MKLLNLPKHVAIIMDGNGRWAKKRNLPRTAGHKAGASRVKEIIETSGNLGIKNLSLFAFSTENWKRPEKEVKNIMKLLEQYLKNNSDDLKDNGIRLNILGDLSKLSKPLQEEINLALLKTKNNDKMILNIGLNYGSQDEIFRAVKKTLKDFIDQGRDPLTISREDFESHLDTQGQGMVDFLIRPSGEYRISNFLLYQCAYAELWFSDILWPDFTKEKYMEALEEYAKRQRRFGGINV